MKFKKVLENKVGFCHLMKAYRKEYNVSEVISLVIIGIPLLIGGFSFFQFNISFGYSFLLFVLFSFLSVSVIDAKCNSFTDKDIWVLKNRTKNIKKIINETNKSSRQIFRLYKKYDKNNTRFKNVSENYQYLELLKHTLTRCSPEELIKNKDLFMNNIQENFNKEERRILINIFKKNITNTMEEEKREINLVSEKYIDFKNSNSKKQSLIKEI